MDSLVTAEWLANEMAASDLRIVDASKHLPETGRDARAEYLSAHIPGAVFFDIDAIAQGIGAEQAGAGIVAENVDQRAGVDRIDMLGVERQSAPRQPVGNPAMDRAQQEKVFALEEQGATGAARYWRPASRSPAWSRRWRSGSRRGPFASSSRSAQAVRPM